MWPTHYFNSVPLKSKYFLKELTKPFGKCHKRPKCRTTKVSYISEIRIIYFHIFTILISLSFDSNQHDVNTYTLSVFDNEPTTLVQQLSVESLRFCCPGWGLTASVILRFKIQLTPLQLDCGNQTMISWKSESWLLIANRTFPGIQIRPGLIIGRL